MLRKKGGQQNEKNPRKATKNSHQFTLVKIHFQMQSFSKPPLTKNERNCNAFKAADPKEIRTQTESPSTVTDGSPGLVNVFKLHRVGSEMELM